MAQGIGRRLSLLASDISSGRPIAVGILEQIENQPNLGRAPMNTCVVGRDHQGRKMSRDNNQRKL